MKLKIFSRTGGLLSILFLLFGCSETDDFNLNDEYVKKQQPSPKVDTETFVSSEKASEFADIFFSQLTEDNTSTKSSSGDQRNSISVETLDESGTPLMYVINYKDGGFVIMGSTKNYYPVLAYSDKNSFTISPELNGVSEWIEETKEAIIKSEALEDTVKVTMQNLWKDFETGETFSPKGKKDRQLKSSRTSAEVACWNRCDELQMQYGGEGWNFLPLSQAQSILDQAGFPSLYDDLFFGADFNHSPINASVFAYKNVYKNEEIGPLLNTEWHQNAPFNDLCNGKPAGCGAIAVSQVMNFYKYPNSFSLNGYAFNWDNIPVNPSSTSDQAALVRLAGNAINTHYNSFGAWATPGDLEDGLELLGYNVSRHNHNFNTVETQLFNYERPVIMGGNSNNIPLPLPLNYIGDSHYWVCDGARRITTGQMLYFTQWQPYGNGNFTTGWNTMNSPGVLGGIGYLYFHMNWGWTGGNNNGWFAFNNVNSGNGNFKYARKDFYISKP